MQIRPINLLDIMMLRNFSASLLSLDSARVITYGKALSPFSLLYRLNRRLQVYTAVCEDGRHPLMGQVTHDHSESFARLAFLSPQDDLKGEEALLLDHLANQTGEWGALYLVAEVDEHHDAFKSLRKAGFAMYAWQKIWRLPSGQERHVQWRHPSASDLLAVQNLYHELVPLLMQVVEPAPRPGRNLVCFAGSELQAFVSLTYGPFGIWAQPLIHPDSSCPTECLRALPASIPAIRKPPVFLCLRSNQAWLESALQECEAEITLQQAVMVKHLAVMQREDVKRTVPQKAFAKPAAPLSHSVKDSSVYRTVDR